MENLVNFWKGKRVLITGHTGFKGSWLSLFLHTIKADVYGISLPIKKNVITFNSMGLNENIIKSFFFDITNKELLEEHINFIKPDFIFHLAAQSLVRYSYENPIETFNTNVNGTMNILDCLRRINKKISTIIVTSDKCYYNDNSGREFVESDKLGGYDPYSSSKACAEILTNAYIKSFFNNSHYRIHSKSINTVRAGNVIGGGDWSKNRLFPDIYRAVQDNISIEIRNKSSTRPWQFVLDPIFGYVKLASMAYIGESKFESSAWNFGPTDKNKNITVMKILKLAQNFSSYDIKFNVSNDDLKMYEAKSLNLSSIKSNTNLRWSPLLSVDEAVKWTTSWYDNFLSKKTSTIDFSKNQIHKYIKKLDKENKDD